MCGCQFIDWQIQHHGAQISASDVFDVMFYGEAVKNESVTQSDEVKIEDMGMTGFTLFLR